MARKKPNRPGTNKRHKSKRAAMQGTAKHILLMMARKKPNWPATNQ